ncbi:MAG: hypothetical protein OMM_10219 [Candidatus Magnetoglobus multicellularis str. Araruama]|uniref:Uncharacterized protein n=1 Tax=Candidatus Magnetoglobus multicellularis str. Araruama TaxID=890399 RepID=A0A1V1P1V1_9BACT|nr:MAG: hypothetical protein OMM_10219 [Candidatus Magnetoglobus multicellularis str. Araruama]
MILIAACYVLTVSHGTHAIAKACQPIKRPSWLTTPQIAGQSVTVGKLGELVILAPFGKDTISVEASEMPFPKLDEQLNIAAKSNQHYLTRSLSSPAQAVRTRAVGVGTPLHPMQSLATDTCFIVSHSK